MITDAAPIAAVTTVGLAERLDGCDVSVIDINDPAIDSYPATALPAPAPDDLAYLIYTSGTTGVPERRRHHPPERGPPGRIHSTSTAGSHRCGPSATPMRSTSRCGRSGVRCCTAAGWSSSPKTSQVPPMTSTPCWYANRSRCSPKPPLRSRALSPQGLESAALVIGAEACPAETVDQWAPGRVMVNVYGPTETTM